MKTKKKIIYLLLAGLLFAQSCTKEEQQANINPTCTITFPSNGQEFMLGDTVSITVVAADQDGIITEVQFFVDGILKKSVDAPPYSYQWKTSGEEAGQHVLKATTTDDKNGSESDELNIELNEETSNFGTFTDPRNGKTYVTVKIGDQTWFAENLDFDTAGSFRNPNSMGYGRYYTLRSAKLACPAGWKLPSDEAWKELEMSMHMYKEEADQIGWRGGAQGMWLKSKEGWYDLGNGTDRYGINVFPAGYKGQEGDLFKYGEEALLWTSTSSGSGDKMDGWYRRLSSGHTGIGRHRAGADAGLSVRCLKD